MVTEQTKKKKHLLDEVDKKLINSLTRNSRRKLVNLAEELNMSHVAVKKRMNKLTGKKTNKANKSQIKTESDNGILKLTAGVDLEKLNICYAIVLAEVREFVPRYLDIIKRCPLTVFASEVTGNYNIMAITVAEDLESLQSILSTCSFRTMEGVRRSEILVGVSPTYPRHMTLKLPTDKTADKAPCGVTCISCIKHQLNSCKGCPSTKHYRGIL